MPATVYLLHLTPPYKHARHYVGWTGRDLAERLADHDNLLGRAMGGRGSSLLAAQKRVGGSWVVARTWTFETAEEARVKERAIKWRAATRQCPLCVSQRRSPSTVDPKQ